MRQLPANGSGLRTLRLDAAHDGAMVAPASVLQWPMAGVVCMAGRARGREHLKVVSAVGAPTGGTGITRRRREPRAQKLVWLCANCGRC
jgi:hypothetical protein